MQNEYRAVIYCRVAREDDEAIMKQETMLRQFAEEQGYTDISVYSDNGFVGFGLNRPAFNRLNEDIAAGLVGTVIVKDISRISRNYIEAPYWVKNIQNKGVSFISMLDGYNADSAKNINASFLQIIKVLSQNKGKSHHIVGQG